VVVKIYDWLVRIAPRSAGDLRDAAARETFRQVCDSARTSGWAAYAFESARELLNVAGVIAAAYFAGVRIPGFRLSGAGRDLRMAARSLGAGGIATVIAVATLAIGIGVNAAIFSVLDAVIFHQVPFRDHDRLVELTSFDPQQKMSYQGTSRQAVSGWRTQTDLFDRVEAYESMSLVYETSRGSEMTTGAAVTPGLFEMLGVRPQIGRLFTAGDGEAGSPLTLIVNDAFWRKEFGGATDLSRAAVQIDGRSYAVVGVMPASFRFPSGGEQVWTPFDLKSPPTGSPAGKMMTPFARLAKGVSLDVANREAQSRGSRVNEAAGWAPTLTAIVWRPGQSVDEKTSQSLWVLSGAVAFLFLIVCANVANLALTRTLSRARELATCAALGASPADLFRSAFFEQALLAGVSTLAGVGIASGAIRIAVAALPDSMTGGTMNAIDLDGRVLVFMAVAGAIAAILFGLPPALIAARGSISQTLGSDGRTTSGSKSANRLRSALVIAEVAVSAILLVGGAMMTRSFIRLASIDQGFDPAGLVSVQLGLPAAGYTDVNRRDEAARDIGARLAGVPFVSAVTVGELPGEGHKVNVGTLEFERDPNRTTGRLFLPLQEVPTNYFSTIGMKIVGGRTFDPADAPGAVVVSERFAAKYFDGNAAGQRFRFTGKSWLFVTGVAADTAAREDGRESQLRLYYPIGGAADAYVMTRNASDIADFRELLIRTSRPDALMTSLADAVKSVDGSIVIWKTALVEHDLADTIARPRVVFVLLAVFACFGLLLAIAGLYGVLACLVAQRRQEIGVRLALGASAGGIRRMVLGNGLTLCGIGMALGLAGSVPLVRAVKTLLYGVDASDPMAIAGSAALLIVTAAFACWWPATDASKTDPTVLLRCD
jgi:putative ABC transport system permease protein